MKQGDEILDGFPQDVTAQLIAYLSGDLSVDQREAFEARVLEDEFFSQRVEEARFALLEAYAEGSLPRNIHERIAPWAASTDYARQYLGITRSLERLSSATQRRGMRSGTFWLIAIAVGLFLAVVSSTFLRLRTVPTPTVAKLEARHRQLPLPATQDNIILLVAQRLRGAGPSAEPPATYRIHAGTPLRIQIILPASYTSNTYSVVVKDQPNSAPVARFTGVNVQGPIQARYVEVNLPAHTLQSGKYLADVDAPGDHYDVAFFVIGIR